MAQSVINRLEKLETDMYFGDGQDNLSMTTRMSLAEDKLDRISNLIDRLTKAVVGVIVAIIGQIILRMLHLL